jgi:hypothetical protein
MMQPRARRRCDVARLHAALALLLSAAMKTTKTKQAPALQTVDLRALEDVNGGAVNWRYHATQAMLRVSTWNPAMVGVGW